MSTFYGVPQRNRSKIDPVLAGFVGNRMYSVVFVLDYIQLVFDDGYCVNAYAPLTITEGEGVTRDGDPEFKNRLCDQIGKYAASVRLDGDAFAIQFDAARIALSLSECDPEAAQIFSPQGELVLRADGIHSVQK